MAAISLGLNVLKSILQKGLGLFHKLTHLHLEKMAAILEDHIFQCIFLEKDEFPIQISLKLVPRGSIDNNPALVQVMGWRRIGDN